MPRPRSVSDTFIFAAILQLLAAQGDRAVSFGSVAKATGLAAATLAQRYGSRDAMVKAAQISAWDALDAATTAAIAATADKGASGLLKALSSQTVELARVAMDFRDDDLRNRASAWRASVEGALAVRLGGAQKGREAAAVAFAAWQGQLFWAGAGDKGFRLKDALKRLT